MRFLKSVFIVICVALILSAVGFLVFLHNQGKQIVEEKLTGIFSRPVSIHDVTLGWPLRLCVEKVRIGDVFSAEEISFNLGFLFSSSPQIVLSNVVVVNPEIDYVAAEDDSAPGQGLSAPPAPTGGKAEKEGAAAASRHHSWTILMRNLVFTHGRFVYRKTSGENPLFIEIKELTLRAENAAYPLAAQKIPFELEGRISSNRVPFSGSRVLAHGWVNFVGKDMNAVVKLLQPDGTEGVAAQVKSVANDMVISGKVNVGLLSQTVASKPVEKYSVGDFVLGAIKSSGVELGMDFSVNTKMDHIRLDNINFSGNLAVKDAAANPAPSPAAAE